MGFMQIQSLEISEIMTETSTEPSSIIYEDKVNGVLDEQKGEVEKINIEKKFITSPADIDVHRKVELQDAEISDKQCQAFKDLCTESNDIFSTDSSDKTYIKHTEWVQRELEILEKARVIVRSVSPWASPIVVVPKRAAPGEPPK